MSYATAERGKPFLTVIEIADEAWIRLRLKKELTDQTSFLVLHLVHLETDPNMPFQIVLAVSSTSRSPSRKNEEN
ncbi:hypothetical protein TNCT_649461 [Trichonephila clavata]|uniref:Uncharacterized protein n=1 Tax=Trichonephila clavata TaxID=2740835 RepID=A0A8X6IJ54_TRICU|nr:hypothetical protein TNCT_649461 [Trichonephila clavata]